MKKKSEFEAPYIGIETIDNTPIFYNRRGDYSVIIKCENPIIQYSADMDAYYDFHHLFTNILKVLGTGYTIQKQDILCKKSFLPPQNRKNDYLSNRYFEHFKGRIYTDISTYLVITGEVERSKFFSFDPRRFDTFIRNITKVLGLFANRGIRAKLLNENEIEIYIKRFLSINFNQQTVSLKNIKAREENLIIGEKNVQCISLVDIDEVNFPSIIKPYKEVNIGLRFPVDLLSFLHDTPSIDTIIYNQVINIPDQRNEANKLEGKKKKHKGMPDPANDLCVEDIERVQSDIAREGQMLVYAHYNIILAGLDDISKAINYVETSLFDCGIIINKQCFNQLELFECALPGNAINLNSYDKFLTTSDAAICLLFKEKLQVTENSPFLTYFTDRQGLPVGIDMSGKEGEKKYTNNSNFFVLGPSGSGKSFYVNSKVRQWGLDNTDIVLVDTGHSYSGMCEYYHGKYITYSESKPISMNPFRITEEEYNVEKKNFLKSLIFLIWKGANGEVKKQEEEIMDITIEKYYSFYFHPFNGYSDAEKEAIRENLLLEFQVNEEEFENEREKEERKILSEKIEKLQQLVEKGEGGEKTNAEKAIQNILIEKGFTRQELDNPETRLLSIIERRIQKKEDPSLFSPSEKEAIGVVFWCNDGNNPNIKETAYAVSLEDLEENPLIDTDEDIANVSEDENSFDGAANTAAIMNFAIKDSLAYPAAQKAIEYAPKGVTGWFIGSIAQNKAISNNLEKVYSSFSIIGGTHFDGWYWSSTEDGAGKDTPKVFALISSLTKGRATSTSKRNSFKIRPIIAIR